MPDHGSVTGLAQQLSAEDKRLRDEAARQIWERYSARLLDWVRRHLKARIRRREDESDVLQSMYKSFCRAQRDGKYELVSRDDVWAMLLTITARKVVNTVLRHTAGVRDVRREENGPGGEEGDTSFPRWTPEHLMKSQPTPEEEVCAREEVERILLSLPEDLRQIVLWKLEGCTHPEIARKIKRTRRTVELKVQRIREKLAAEG
jgi:RNA polymerase sigma factor (sigma-70 family)